MMQSNISTAKSQLSRLLERVKFGEEVTITDRDQPVALLIPFRASSTEGGWAARAAELTRRGQIAPPASATGSRKMTVPLDEGNRDDGASLAKAIIEERRQGR